MIALQIVHQRSEELDVAVLDLPRLGKREQEIVVDLSISNAACGLLQVVMWQSATHVLLFPVQLA
jgi:hypothetical protein